MDRSTVKRLAIQSGFQPDSAVFLPMLHSFAEKVIEAAIADADSPWKNAVIEQLVVAHILTAEHESDPRKAIQDLLAYNSEIAVDPRVSDAAALLAEQARAEEREACAKLCDPAPGVKYSPNTLSAMISCAFAIRARGQK